MAADMKHTDWDRKTFQTFRSNLLYPSSTEGFSSLMAVAADVGVF
jgi:hypothetical protein